MAGIRSAMRSPLRSPMRSAMDAAQSLTMQALSILRSFGSNAHVYLPGANGAAVSGLLSRNYEDSSLTTLASIDGVVGGVVDAIGSINATQATTANKPAERRGLYNLLLQSATPATQSVTCAASPYTLAIYGSGSITLSGTGSGALNGSGGSSLDVLQFTPTAGSVTFTKSGTVTSFGLFQGTLTAAQILAEGGIPLTTTAAASNPTSGRYWWSFDGTDSLTLGSVPFQMADDHAVVACLNASAGGSAAFYNGNAGGTVHCGTLRTASGGEASAWWRDDSAAQDVLYGVGSVLGSVVVLSCCKRGNTKILRVNGVEVASATTVLGTTTLDSTTIGKSPSDLFSGAIYALQSIRGTVTDAQLLTLERWVASLTPNAPSF